MVGKVIDVRFGVKLSKASVCRLLAQLGLTPQYPIWRAYQQISEKIQRWLKKEYPKIRDLASRDKAKIFFGDEAGVRSDLHAGTPWAVQEKNAGREQYRGSYWIEYDFGGGHPRRIQIHGD